MSYLHKFSTVKLGYNEHSVITTRFLSQIGHFSAQINPNITNNSVRSRAVRYSRVWLFLIFSKSLVSKVKNQPLARIKTFCSKLGKQWLSRRNFFPWNKIFWKMGNMTNGGGGPPPPSPPPPRKTTQKWWKIWMWKTTSFYHGGS